MNNSEPQYLSVSEVNRRFNQSLEKMFPEISFVAEISELSRPTSGHIYFTLKDADAQLAAVIWRGLAQSLSFKLEQGLSVLCRGRPNVYQKTGRLQVILNEITPAGEGLLRKKYLELKAKLEKEGLFALERKRKLPFLPKAIGIVTSPSGAVIHDIMIKISERMPTLKVFLLGVRVQGPGSVAEIKEAIEYFNQLNNVDVIIVARGGGSLEDLWSFNEEIVVRAIFASRIPVISGVGHETDITLSDLAADVRAPTPTAAAEMVVPKREDLLKVIGDFEKRLKEFRRWLDPLAQELDELELRLGRSLLQVFEQASLKLNAAQAKLRLIEPQNILQAMRARLQLLEQKLRNQANRTVQIGEKMSYFEQTLFRGTTQLLKNKSHELDKLSARFQAMDPKRVLERGYAMVEHKGKVLRASADVELGDIINVRLYKGSVAANVTGKE